MLNIERDDNTACPSRPKLAAAQLLVSVLFLIVTVARLPYMAPPPAPPPIALLPDKVLFVTFRFELRAWMPPPNEIRGLVASQLHWVSRIDLEMNQSMQCTVKTRYRQDDVVCTITRLDDENHQVIFEQAQSSVTPGQSVVFYQNEICLGGGIIDTLIR